LPWRCARCSPSAAHPDADRRRRVSLASALEMRDSDGFLNLHARSGID